MLYEQLDPLQWATLLGCAFMIGMSRAGLKGLGMVLAVLMAFSFPAKASTGLILPMFIMADVASVIYYRRDADWGYILRLLPAAIVGVLLGAWIGESLDDETFGRILAIVVIFGLVLLIWQKQRPIPERYMRHPIVAGTVGLMGGFTTMIGNAAGAIMAVYLLATRLPKREFIGTSAWFFLLMNWFKLPVHIWSWKTITRESFQLNLLTIPAIALGFVVGIRIIKMIPEQAFRYFVMAVTALTALRILFR